MQFIFTEKTDLFVKLQKELVPIGGGRNYLSTFIRVQERTK